LSERASASLLIPLLTQPDSNRRLAMPADDLGTPLGRQMFRRRYRCRRFYVSHGVAALAPDVVIAAMAEVARFERFERTGQFGGEHPGGILTISGHRLVWRVECYDRPWRARPFGNARLTVEVRVVSMWTKAEVAALPDHPSPVVTLADAMRPSLTTRGWAYLV
jgi:hypothetical protein